MNHSRTRHCLVASLLAIAPASCAVLAGCGRARPAAPAATAAPLRFRDIAAAAGIDFIPEPGLRSPMNILQTAGYGGGFLDYDGDGWVDVLLVGNPRCRLYRNEQGGRFRDVTAAAGLDLPGHWMGCAAADFDNDGRPDLFLSGYRTAALLHNEGGRFRRLPLAVPPDLWSASAAFFDYDGDGWLDLYASGYLRFGAGTPRLCEYEGVKAACPPGHYDAQVGRLYRNLQGRRFVDTTRAAGLQAAHGKTLGVAALDYDADGDQDLYLANDGMPGDLFENRGGRFVNVGVQSGTAFNREGAEQAGMGVDWGDVDADGRPDLVVTTFQFEPTSLYLNRGGGLFQEEGARWGVGDATVLTLGFGARFFDPDNDGRLDLLIANGHVQDLVERVHPGVTFRQPAQLFRWEEGRFEEVRDEAIADARRAIVGRAVATGDYDNDGRVDVLLTNLEGPPLLLHNETERAGHWLSLRLEDPAGPRDGSGATIILQAAGRSLTRYAGTGGSYLAASDARVHAGLGTSPKVDTLTVRWSSGRTETWRDVAADQRLLLRSGRPPEALRPSAPGPT